MLKYNEQYIEFKLIIEQNVPGAWCWCLVPITLLSFIFCLLFWILFFINPI